MGIKAIVIRGDFTPEEFAGLVGLIRNMDSRRPDARFEICAVDPDDSAIETAEKLVRDAVPPLEGRVTEFATIRWPNGR